MVKNNITQLFGVRFPVDGSRFWFFRANLASKRKLGGWCGVLWRHMHWDQLLVSGC